jgi:uncharacterized protein YjbJ (UPF0337 family)
LPKPVLVGRQERCIGGGQLLDRKPLIAMKESTKDKIKGAVDETSGKIKQEVGKATEDPNLHDEGTSEEVGGKVRSKIGDIKKVFEK